MPLTVQSLSVAIICDGEELEAYGVKQEDRNSITAFVASEVGKVSARFPRMIPLVSTRSQQLQSGIQGNLHL